MLVLNFSHPLTPAQLNQLEALTGAAVERVMAVASQFDVQQAFAPQVQALLACHGSVTVQGRALHVALHDASAVGALRAQLGALPLTLHRVVYGQTDLEQLFMSLTQRSLRD